MVKVAEIPTGTAVTPELLSEWTSCVAYTPGEIVMQRWQRSRLAIWLDRIRLFHWDVPDQILEAHVVLKTR